MLKSSGTKFGAFSDNSQPSHNGKTTTGSNSLSSKENTGSSKVTKVEPNDFVTKRFGLKYDPPTIIMEYLVPSSGKLYHHKMKLPHLRSNSDTMETVEALKKKHAQYFIGNKVSDTQIKSLVEKLKKQAPAGTNNEKTTNDLNNGKNGTSASSSSYKPSSASKPLQTGKDKTNGNGFWDFDDIEDDDEGEEVDYQNANLNKLSKEELQKHKDKMDVLFNKNNKKPGDPGFVYDKQETFVPNKENEWDDDDDDF